MADNPYRYVFANAWPPSSVYKDEETGYLMDASEKCRYCRKPMAIRGTLPGNPGPEVLQCIPCGDTRLRERHG